MGTRNAYENYMDDLHEKEQMLEWLGRHIVTLNEDGWQLKLEINGRIHYYHEGTFLNTIRKAMTEHV